MPEIDYEELKSKLARVPAANRDAFLEDVKKAGYTWKKPLPKTPGGQTIYPQPGQGEAPRIQGAPFPMAPLTPENMMGMRGSAMEGIAKFARETAPEAIAKGVGVGMGMPKAGATMAGLAQAGAQMVPLTPLEAGAQMFGGPALKAAGKLAKPVGKVTGDILAELVAHVSSSTPEAVKIVFQKPGVMKKFRQLIGEAEQSNLVKVIGDHISNLGSKIRDFEREFSAPLLAEGAHAVKVGTGEVADRISSILTDAGYSIPKEISGKEARLIDRIANVKEREELAGFLRVMKENPNMGWGDALNLKRQVDDAINYARHGGLSPRGDSAQHALKVIRSEVSEALASALPKEKQSSWKEANLAYHEALKAFEDMGKNAVGTGPEKTASKLLNRLKKGYQDIGINQKAAKIGEGAAKAIQDLQEQVAAGTFKKYVSGWGHGGFAQVLPTSPAAMGGLTALAGLGSQAAAGTARALQSNPIALRIALQLELAKHGEQK